MAIEFFKERARERRCRDSILSSPRKRLLVRAPANWIPHILPELFRAIVKSHERERKRSQIRQTLNKRGPESILMRSLGRMHSALEMSVKRRLPRRRTCCVRGSRDLNITRLHSVRPVAPQCTMRSLLGKRLTSFSTRHSAKFQSLCVSRLYDAAAERKAEGK